MRVMYLAAQQQQQRGGVDRMGALSFGAGSDRRGSGFLAAAPSVPPPPPSAKPAVTQAEGGSGFSGAVSFVVESPADIK